MKRAVRWMIGLSVLAAAAGGALAQSVPPPDARARAAAKDVQDAEPAVTPSRAAAPAPPAAAPTAARPAPPAPGDRPPAPERSPRAQDRLELETTQITGNRELPKVMVVVPWKRSDIGDLVGRPVNSLVDEALQPVDRAEFRREIDYYGALAPDRPRDETHVTGGAGKERPEK
jgi:hypothetical protein